jgi:enamine deaminase RidA (YjgF/YER057c/UK114 family)
MKRRLINPPGTEKIYERLQFSQAVRVGDTVWVSGQVGMDGNKPADGIEAQSRIAFENVRRVLAEAGATLSDVVELVTFHKEMSDLPGFSKVKADFFPKNYPAWTAIGTTELAFPGLLVEIRATAVVGSGVQA